MKHLFLILLFLLLTSCASIDPREGGLVGGIVGIQSGAYDKQKRSLENRVSQSEKSRNSLLAESRRLDAELAKSRRAERYEIQRVNSISKRVAVFRNRVRLLSKDQSGNKIKLTQTKVEINQTRNEINTISQRQRNLDSANKRTNRELTVKINKLNKELELLANSI